MTTPDYHALNALLNLYDENGQIQFDKDREAANQFFLQHVNQNTIYFHDLEEKIRYLIDNNYYDPDVINAYNWDFVKDTFKRAYAYKFRFKSFLGAYKYYTSYTLKTFDGSRYLERFEDRVAMTALFLADGDEELASALVDEIMTGRFQPATPTFLNAGKAQRGELVSCFLLRIEDNMESIGRAINSSLQLSKRGGGVALLLSNLRESGAPIKHVENQSSGVIPVMKILEDSFSYANQLGARQGAGAVYLNAHHPDIMKFLDTKRENADEKIRIKTLSLGVVIPNITFELAKRNDDMYLFSPYDVKQVYGKPLGDISVTEKYEEMVEDPRIRKTKINARQFFQTIAEIQFESGYPYIMFEDTVNRANPVKTGRINMSNLCVTGDTLLATDTGLRTAAELYETQDNINVVTDNRAREMNLETGYGTRTVASTKMHKTAENADVYLLDTIEGYQITATPWHKFYVKREGELIKIPLADIVPGDRVLIQSGEGTYGNVDETDLAYLAGTLASDGTFTETRNGTHVPKWYLYGHKAELRDAIETAAANILAGRDELRNSHNATLEPKFTGDNDRFSMSSAPLGALLAEKGVTRGTKTTVPQFVVRGNRETQRAYLSGVFQLDASITGSKSNKSCSIELGSVHKPFLVSIQRLLASMGVYSRIYNGRAAGENELPDGHGGTRKYNAQQLYTLRVSDSAGRIALHDALTWTSKQEARWEELGGGRETRTKAPFHKFTAVVKSLEPAGVEDVYDVTVEEGHSLIFNGIATGNCSEILQVNSASELNDDLTYAEIGQDISCNLGSLNVAMAMDSDNFARTIETAIRGLTAVSDKTAIHSVPSIREGNNASHAIGLGQMNLHGYLGREHIHYGSEEALDFTNAYFAAVMYQTLRASHAIAVEKGESFSDFDQSEYATGEFFDRYDPEDFKPKTGKVKALFDASNITTPTADDWEQLKQDVARDGIYNRYLQAVPPTGSISYINNSTSSIHPIASKIEIRKEGKIGRVYYPAPHMDNENQEYFKDAYEIGYKAIVDTYAVATRYVDQGLSLTMFFKDTVTTRDLNRAQIYAWTQGIKTLYYIRLRQMALEGTAVDGCVSCML